MPEKLRKNRPVHSAVDRAPWPEDAAAWRSPVTAALHAALLYLYLHALSPTPNPRVFPSIPMCNSPPLS